MKKKEYQKKMAKEKKALKDLDLNDNSKNIKNGIIISLGVIGFIFLVFAFTKVKTGEWDLFTVKNDPTYSAQMQTTKILCGSILNREDDEYFVLAYELNEDEAQLYESILERYNSSEKKKPLYKLDLGNSRNNICLSDKVNITNNIEDLKLIVPTLLQVKNGKIINHYTTYDSIKKTLNSYVD